MVVSQLPERDDKVRSLAYSAFADEGDFAPFFARFS